MAFDQYGKYHKCHRQAPAATGKLSQAEMVKIVSSLAALHWFVGLISNFQIFP
jgi:hypothetical protein